MIFLYKRQRFLHKIFTGANVWQEANLRAHLGFFVFQVHLENAVNNFSPQGLKQKKVQTQNW